MNCVYSRIDQTAIGQNCLRGALEVYWDVHCDQFGERDLHEVNMTHDALHRVALQLFDDCRILCIADFEFEDCVRACRAGESKT